MNIQVKIKKNNMLYTFIAEVKADYKGKITEIDNEKIWFLNEIKQLMEEVL